MADWHHVRAVSTATGMKMCDTASRPYLTVLFAEALLAAASGSLDVWLRCDLAYVSRTVTSQAIGLPRTQGSSVIAVTTFLVFPPGPRDFL